ncbi:radical SAM protein [Endozoicomonas sp. ALB032]|uniref:radical SAM protein n=1 Tax=Endozoicomonas sp. ALB032 TaxID=3403082 RepID=UPI003BB7409B
MLLTGTPPDTKSQDWHFTPDGSPRGYIKPHQLKELWFHTGTRCNLSCSFCLEGSSPASKRLDAPTLTEVKPYIDESLELGVEQFSFTGGEPFVIKDIIRILDYASQHRPCLVLTNGTTPMIKRLDELTRLSSNPYPISLRVSLDHPNAEQHDAGRGEDSFAIALSGLKLLHENGFNISVARHMEKDENTAVVEQAFRDLFELNGLPINLKQVAFPDFLPPGSLPDVPHVSTDCMTRYQTEESRRQFMCAFSKMMVKQNGQMQVYACTLVDDDTEYNLGKSLRTSLSETISMKHHRCYSCFAFGSSCSEL